MSVINLLDWRDPNEHGVDSPHLPVTKSYKVPVHTSNATATDVYDLDSKLAEVTDFAESLGVVLEFDSEKAEEI
jgi:hypothetical protein